TSPSAENCRRRTWPNCASCWRTWTMASEILIEATLAMTAGLLLVLVLRRLVRRLSGAAAAYALWALVPVTLLAVLLPAPVQPVAQAMSALVVVPATPFQAVADTAGAPSWLA